MPAIGTLSFAVDDGFDSGIAMDLAKSPETAICFNYGNCQLLAAPTEPHMICRFSGATSFVEAYNKGSALLQEALDVLSIVGRADLLTKDAEDEHLLWWNSGGRRVFSLVSTTKFSVKVGQVVVTVRDAQGNIVPPITITPKHHLGFRFYRLSQASDDLYDAYRNMYLAFESLLSSRFPKGKGLEIDWLRQSLAAASADLSLPHFVPPGTSDPVAHVLKVIYEGARLPLFHAKDGKAYFAPAQSDTERGEVANALKMLTNIVLRMADKWFSARRGGGWFNLKLFEEQHRKLFDGAHFVFTDNPAFTLEDNLQSETISNGVPFPATFSEQFGSVFKHHVVGGIPVSALASKGRLRAIYLVNARSPLIALSADTSVDLTGFDDLQRLCPAVS